jgi:hypothetical protein
MARRKKPVPRRPRRSPYERSLEYATKRLERAIEEQRACQLRLQSLNNEIPYLQTVIRALTPVKMVEVRPDPYSPKVESPWLDVQTPEHLRQFTGLRAPEPIYDNEDVSQEDFLAGRIPGTEVLP